MPNVVASSFTFEPLRQPPRSCSRRPNHVLRIVAVVDAAAPVSLGAEVRARVAVVVLPAADVRLALVPREPRDG